MPDFFISHATLDDTSVVDPLVEVMVTRGLTAWVDHQVSTSSGIAPGSPNWDAAIRAGIASCTAGLLIMTPRALKSDICMAECLLLRELGKPLYIAYAETCPPESIWLTIKVIQWADCRTDRAAGIDRLVAAYRGTAIAGVAASDLPTALRGKLTGWDVVRANLPYLTSVPLTGRAADVQAISAQLGAYVTQVIAVGGTGKSRIAAEVAQDYPHGAVWHRCEDTSIAGQIIGGLRQHFGLDDKATDAQILDTLDRVAHKPLIVVDNAEAVPDAGRAAYITICQTLTGDGAPLLLTSRVVWPELKPRHDYPLAPIPPDPAAAIALDFAKAEQLTLDTAGAAALAEACHCHPRLIEFAVRQLHERSIDKVIRQVRELKHRDVQKMLDEMIVSTVRQMREQAEDGTAAADLLPWLTILRGTFNEAAAIALKPESLDEDTLDDALVTLQRWGFVRRDPVTNRYSIDDVVRDAVPPAEGSAARHFDHFYKQYGDFDTNRNEDTHPQLLLDWPNIRAALSWGFAESETIAKQAVRWANAVDYFMQLRLDAQTRKSILSEGLAAAQRHADQPGQAAMYRSLGDVARMQDDTRRRGRPTGRRCRCSRRSALGSARPTSINAWATWRGCRPTTRRRGRPTGRR